MINVCKNCGCEYNATTKKSKFCSRSCYAKHYVKTHTNAICPMCGKAFYSNGPLNPCCSIECGHRYSHKRGIQTYWKCIEEERNIPSLAEWIDNEHNNKMRTIVDIANELNASRITIMRWCKEWGIKTRSVSEDNHRRYSTMSQDDKNKQTQAAHIGIRKLFKNEEWKNNQIQKVLSAQNYRESRPEKAIKSSLIDHGYGDFNSQYQLGPYFIDIAFEDIKLAVEIDGEYWHSLPDVVNRDRRKNGYIKHSGWQLLRLPATPCLKQTEQIVWDIIQHIETIKLEMAYEQ